MRVTLIHNPGAGDDEQQSGAKFLALIRGAGHEAVYRSSKEDGWGAALEDPGDLVAVAGGDGTVGKVARRLIGRRVPLAVLPEGTANNISKSLGLTGTHEELIRGWGAARRVKFDAGVATGPFGERTFIEGLGAGLFADTMSKLDARDNIALAHLDDAEEKLAHVLRMLRERSRDCPARKLTASLDGRDVSGEYLLVEAMNTSRVGPNLRLAPGADFGDGQLDVVLVSEGERGKLSEYLAGEEGGRGRPAKQHLTVLRGRRLQLQWEGFDIHIDDEVWPGAGSPFKLERAAIDVRLDRHALEFLVP